MVKYRDLDHASDRFQILKEKQLLVRELLDKHKLATQDLDKLEAVKPNTQLGWNMVKRKRADILKKMQEHLQGVDSILKEYPELSKKQHLDNLKEAIHEDIFANDNNAKNFNEQFKQF